MSTNNNLDNKRHTLAHLLASAVLDLYPDTKNTIGPAIDNGFYYDFDFTSPLSEADLPKIEAKMKELLPTWLEFTTKTVSEAEAKTHYKTNPYKQELIDEIVAKGEPITFYTIGAFTDLCRGGHLTNPAKDINPLSFKLDRLAGAYWRGDEKNKMLTRIYGLAFNTKVELDTYLTDRQEAEKRDHRKIGQDLGLFTFSDLVGSGLPLFTPRGTLMRELIVDKIKNIQKDFGYENVAIPHITKKELYQTSGHWDKFKDELFHVKGVSKTEFVMKPMNCPHHTQIYASEPRSYKDLPIRYSETTMVYRDEQAGELLGLARVRSVTQDDGHVFCTLDQVEQEIINIISVIKQFYSLLNMFKPGQYWVSLSVRDEKTPEKYLGDPTDWTTAEKMLEKAAQAENLDYKRVSGEAAFYGPKLDFMFKDSLGRERQLATAQVDFVMPERFGLNYTDTDGQKKTPVMIHRAIAGSLERFMAIMIEHFAGAFPLWLSPTQISIIPIAESHETKALDLKNQLINKGFRVNIYLADDSLGKRIRKAKTLKTPYLAILGDKEVETQTITLESRDTNESLNLSLADIIQKLQAELN